VSNWARSVIAAVVITVVFFVLVLPLPEMDATARCRAIVISIPPAAITPLSPVLSIAVHEMSPWPKVKDRPELLATLCVRNC
jgi:hypothetical protein